VNQSFLQSFFPESMNAWSLFSCFGLLLCAGLLLTGCRSMPKSSPGRIDVNFAAGPVMVAGGLDEAVWSRAKPIPFELVASPSERRRIGKLEGNGSVRLLHDDKNLYIAFAFEDADVVDLSKEDDQELCTLSDVAEVFLKPLDDTWYWEFHVTPKGRVSTYWWPGRGRLGLVGTQPHVKPRFIQVATWTQGTINNDHDRDQGWTALVAIPFAKLDRYGPPKDPHSRWTILLSRYDYSRYRMKGTGPELSAASALSEPNFHLVDEYPRLHLRDAAKH
jgi:hypothetical protein